MAKHKMTQKKAVFYMLLAAWRRDKTEYVPAWKFVGELYIEELDEWFFMSYKCPANGVNIYFENPGLIQRRETKGRSGSKYFEYRLDDPSIAKIVDTDLRNFYLKIKQEKRRSLLKPIIPN